MNDSSTQAELEKLLAEDMGAAAQRAADTFDERAQPFENQIVLFGAGGLGRRTLAGLRGMGIEPLALADNSPSLQGQIVDGMEVLSAQEAAARYGQNAAFVVTIWGAGSTHRLEQTQRQLINLGCGRVVSFALLYWKYPEVFLPFYCRERPQFLLEEKSEVQRAFDLWSDEASRAEYVSQVRWRLQPEYSGLSSPASGAQYFPSEIELRDNECFVDVGAYDGDTLKIFVEKTQGLFRKFVALEPDPLNFQKLQSYVASLPDEIRAKIMLGEVAAGAEQGMIRVEATGTAASSVGQGEVEVPVVRLDEYLKQHANEAATWLKLDIEGAEPDVLQGAQKIIRGDAPIVAVCVYHRQNHLWKIPLTLQAWRDDYRFSLRAHNEEGWDLVCYAVPENRWNPIPKNFQS